MTCIYLSSLPQHRSQSKHVITWLTSHYPIFSKNSALLDDWVSEFNPLLFGSIDFTNRISRMKEISKGIDLLMFFELLVLPADFESSLIISEKHCTAQTIEVKMRKYATKCRWELNKLNENCTYLNKKAQWPKMPP